MSGKASASLCGSTNRLEIYAKLRLGTASLDELRRIATAVVQAARAQAGCIRCDWFLHAGRREAIVMLVYHDAAALRGHRAAAADCAAQLRRMGQIEVEFLGQPTPEALTELQSCTPGVLQFSSGLDVHSGAQRFNPPVAAPQRAIGEPQHIEIYTRFTIRGDCLAKFKADADELLQLVKTGDPSTSRYDWFFDDARLACVAMDTYADAPGMFAHMKNCHDAHAKLLDGSVMVTEFLGSLPPEAMQAVAKYDPYIAPFLVGLGQQSAGGI